MLTLLIGMPACLPALIGICVAAACGWRYAGVHTMKLVCRNVQMLCLFPVEALALDCRTGEQEGDSHRAHAGAGENGRRAG